MIRVGRQNRAEDRLDGGLPLRRLVAGDGGADELVGAGQGFEAPAQGIGLSSLLRACLDITGADAELRWTDPEVILEAGIEPWTQLPVWVPPGGEMYDAVHRADVSRAVATGLVCRPVGETVADTWRWLTRIGGTAPQRPDRTGKGLDPDVESKVLAAGGGVADTTP